MAQLKILSHLLLVTSKPHQTPESQNLQILQAVCPGSGGAGLRKPGAGTLQRSPVALPRKRKLMETYGNLPNLCRLPNLSSSHQKDALLESKHWIFVDRQCRSPCIHLPRCRVKGSRVWCKFSGKKHGKEAATGHDKNVKDLGNSLGQNEGSTVRRLTHSLLHIQAELLAMMFPRCPCVFCIVEITWKGFRNA